EQSSFQKHSDVIRDSLVGLIISDSAMWKEISETESDKDWSQHDTLVRFILEGGPSVGFIFDKLLAGVEDGRAIERLRKIYFDAKYLFTREGVEEYSPEQLRDLVSA